MGGKMAQSVEVQQSSPNRQKAWIVPMKPKLIIKSKILIHIYASHYPFTQYKPIGDINTLRTTSQQVTSFFNIIKNINYN